MLKSQWTGSAGGKFALLQTLAAGEEGQTSVQRLTARHQQAGGKNHYRLREGLPAETAVSSDNRPEVSHVLV